MDLTSPPIISTYPIHLVVQGRNIWLAWRCVDEIDEALLKRDGVVLWASTKSDLIEKCSGAHGEWLRSEEDTKIDLDSLLSRLIARDAISGSEVINGWNMLTDIQNSLPPVVGARFNLLDGSLLEAYDHFFSDTVAADMLEFGRLEITDGDIQHAIEVVSTGMVMLLDMVDGDGRSGSVR